MNHDHELRLHIATPEGVKFNDLILYAQIKVHDGFVGVNRNQLPTIRIIQLGIAIIKYLNGTTEEFLLGPGVMLIDKYFCQIYAEFFLNSTETTDQYFLDHHREIEQKLFDQKLEGIFDHQTEITLRREIAKLSRNS
ncbi:F0F1-type ATP synthase epsilon subunit [Mycoplasmoides fastidiosum]|uniref:F0F1-type ATP synthase epsilon subunit n=1 Tax=Mycoplasmoides fastidiosum TaxID=92758 RepID=A0ABU0LYI3_9BACT|nr:hypothetical protein [Mycoplasmoides fastidiosum]MDQ0513762.1 F0F1-type ATP synthase epsilon subunit [Mycoplasmoides fastidiosum]UUD37817.1 hypothetical protein NPA10_00255 [Mycoplasmoides fastidiosum]